MLLGDDPTTPGARRRPLDARDLDAFQYLFFTGKGGVGKTSVSCAVATALADSGERVLLVTTDPASNLGDVFGQQVGRDPVPARDVPGLWLEEVDPVREAAAYRERVVGPYRGILPDDAIANIEEQLSGSCTVEIAAFDRFACLLADEGVASAYDHIVFDTAPTGHTLRMLELPSAWTSFLDENTTGTSCLGQLSGLGDRRADYRRAMDVLKDESHCALVLVSRPQRLSLGEAARSARELGDFGIRTRLLVVNGCIEGPAEETARAMAASQREALDRLPEGLRDVERRWVPLRAFDVTGANSLRRLLSPIDAPSDEGGSAAMPASATDAAQAVPSERAHAARPQLASLADLTSDLLARGVRVVLTMGKGGVGKTSVAVEVARRLAAAGERVRLTTTDPADHIAAFDLEGLEVSHIDEAAELARYQEEVLAKARETMGADDLAYVEEDLRSPCTQEIATFRAFARIVEHADEETVVVDTAPTGHTLLLLGSAQSLAKQIEHTGGDVPQSVVDLLPRLRDPAQTQIVVVTLPEDTPVREATRLVADLDRARIPHGWWVVNQCLSLTRTSDPVLAARAAAEAPWIERARELSAGRLVGIPWDASGKVG